MEKTNNIWSIICKRPLVDEQSKLASLIDIVERLVLDVNLEKAPKEIKDSYVDERFNTPLQIQDTLTVASYWSLQKEHRGVELDVETRIIDNTGNKLASGKLTFKTNSNNTNYRTFFTITSFPISSNGIYKVESVLLDKKGEIIAKGATPITIDLKVA